MLTIEEKTPYQIFLDSIGNPNTRREYTNSFRRFMEYYKIAKPDDLLKIPLKQAENIIINYILYLKKSNSEDYVTAQISAVKRFFYMNDITLNWDKINEFKKGNENLKNKTQPYNAEQIQKLLEVCDNRTRAIVLIFCSTGIRLGGLAKLQRKHLNPIPKHSLYEFRIYAGSKDEYITYCTPECAGAINNYLDFRKRSGEKLGPESYLIRQQFDITDIEQIRKDSRPVSDSTIRNILLTAMVKAGIREVDPTANKATRKEIPMIHGFRYFFSSELTNANLNPTKRWLLEGHGLLGNDNSYVKVQDTLLDEYLKAIDNLTINNENRLKKKVEMLTVEKAKVDLLEQDLAEIKKLILGK